MSILTPEEELIKSRQRVRAHGEVFTPRSMVNQMLDLVKPELETGSEFVDKTFFEPAAGSGNFLVAILQRKLDAVAKQFPPSDWNTESLFALASIYGIELLADNHAAAQRTMMETFFKFHSGIDSDFGSQSCLYRSAQTIIELNVLRGDTLLGVDSVGKEIQFSWWNRVAEQPGMVLREPFSFASLRNSGADMAMIDFSLYLSYEPCLIEHVYKEQTK